MLAVEDRILRVLRNYFGQRDDVAFAFLYLDVKWDDMKRFIQLVPELYPLFLDFVEKEVEK